MARAAKHPVQGGAIRMLMQDHRQVEKLLREYEQARGAERKAALRRQICDELSVHARLEEEMFYPVLRQRLDEAEMLDEAEVEHGVVKDLIEELRDMQAGEPLLDAKVKVLGEYVKHHVEEEETEMFPKVRRQRIDTAELASSMQLRAAELRVQFGLPEAAAPKRKRLSAPARQGTRPVTRNATARRKRPAAARHARG